MSEEPQPLEQPFDIEVPLDVEPGVHADIASILHTAHTFVLAFASHRLPAEVPQDPDSGQRIVALPSRVVCTSSP